MTKDPFFSTKNILIIDASDKQSNDRTWCFWSPDDYGYQSSRKSWSTINFKSDTHQISERIDPLQYHHIEGKDFYQEIFSLVSKADNIHFIRDSIIDINGDELNYAEVITEKTNYLGHLVFNSVPALAYSTSPKVDLWQHFYGYKVKTENQCFDTNSVTLMDFSIGENTNRVQFGYVLPFSKNEALIEYTEFSGQLLHEKEYQVELNTQLNAMGISNYTIIEKEIGKIPMCNLPEPNKIDHVIHLGTVAGLTKPTTGYTFRNIQVDSLRIINALKSSQLKTRKPRKRRFQFYDNLLLKIISNEPHQVKKIMSCLFSRNQIRHVFKFLDESTSLFDEIKIFLSIPWGPFLRQLIKK
jgi:lycopene beta-cyclase